MLHPDTNDIDTSLSVDSATLLLNEAPVIDQEHEQISAAEPSAVESGEPETAIAAEENAGEPDDLPAIEAPHSWDAESRARFGELPREHQELIVARERERDAGLSRALEDVASKRKEAESTASKLGHYALVLDQLVPQAQSLFQDRWAQIDWAQLPDAIGAEETLKLRLQYETEQKQLGELQAVREVLETEQFGAFVQAEAVQLARRSPELADPKLGPERKKALAHYLVSQGVPPDRLRLLTAYEADIAYKAQKYDALMANAAKAKQPNSPAQGRNAVRPTAAQPARSSATQAQQQAKERFRSSGRIDDAVALLNART